MKIEISAEGFEPGEALSHFARCCVGFELGAQRNLVASVRLQLADEDAARGGKEHSCLVQVDLCGRHEVITKVADTDLHVAIHRALERASWMVAHRLQREQGIASEVRVVEQGPAGQPEADRAA